MWLGDWWQDWGSRESWGSQGSAGHCRQGAVSRLSLLGSRGFWNGHHRDHALPRAVSLPGFGDTAAGVQRHPNPSIWAAWSPVPHPGVTHSSHPQSQGDPSFPQGSCGSSAIDSALTRLKPGILPKSFPFLALWVAPGICILSGLVARDSPETFDLSFE